MLKNYLWDEFMWKIKSYLTRKPRLKMLPSLASTLFKSLSSKPKHEKINQIILTHSKSRTIMDDNDLMIILFWFVYIMWAY